jgi:hypothetical protein
MNKTVKALIFGSTIAAVGLSAAVVLMPPAPVVKLQPVVVTAQRMPAKDVVRIATVEVTASRAQVLAAQTQEAGKQAAAASNPKI